MEDVCTIRILRKVKGDMVTFLGNHAGWMKKYCIVSFCNIYRLPYAKIYINKIIENGNLCTLLFWDRDADADDRDNYAGCEKLTYRRKLLPASTKIDKLIGYIQAMKYITKVLYKNDFDGVIFLQTHAAVACCKVLMQKYKKKYIVDIRDYSLENHYLYFQREKRVIGNSFTTVISSPAYSQFLPRHEYVVAHNYSPYSYDEIDAIRNRKKSDDPIVISFIGTVRFVEMDKKMVNLFKNDKRFVIGYYGIGSDVLKQYCIENGINNVIFYGAFPSQMTLEFYKKTDVINNIYGNNSKFLDYALSNKLYYAGQFHIPIIVCPNTYMAKVVTENGMGFVFDINNLDEPDILYEWFHSLDKQKLDKNCDMFIESVMEDNKKFLSVVDRFVL